MTKCRERCLWCTCIMDLLWYITWTCASQLVCVCACVHLCMHTHMHVCAFMYECLCVYICVFVCVSVCRCWYAWNSPADRVLAYSPAQLGCEYLQFWSCCANAHSLLFSTSIPKVLPGGLPCIKCSTVIPFPYMEFSCIFIILLSMVTVYLCSGPIINTAY